jgi:hypothetical protein
VYEVLKQKNRQTGGYRWHNRLADLSMDPGEALDELMGRVLYQAARSLRDGRRAEKFEETAALKAEILHESAVLEKVATAHAAVGQLADAECIRRAATRWAAMANDVRGADDPLTIQRDHGDYIQRAVQCDVAKLFLDHLGNGMHTLAAMIAGAAVGKPALDAWVSRAALSKARADN